MANTTTQWASGTPTTSGTTWASATAATGSNNGAFATWTNASRRATGYIEVAGFGLQSLVPSGATIDSITVRVYHYESSTSVITGVDAYTFAGTSQRETWALTPSQTSTNYQESTRSNSGAIYSWADLSDFRVQVAFTRANSTTSAVGYVDAVSVYVTYTPSVVPVTGTASSAWGIYKTIEQTRTSTWNVWQGVGVIGAVGGTNTTFYSFAWPTIPSPADNKSAFVLLGIQPSTADAPVVSGWTKLDERVVSSPGTSIKYVLYRYDNLTGSESGTVTFTPTTSTLVSGFFLLTDSYPLQGTKAVIEYGIDSDTSGTSISATSENAVPLAPGDVVWSVMYSNIQYATSGTSVSAPGITFDSFVRVDGNEPLGAITVSNVISAVTAGTATANITGVATKSGTGYSDGVFAFVRFRSSKPSVTATVSSAWNVADDWARTEWLWGSGSPVTQSLAGTWTNAVSATGANNSQYAQWSAASTSSDGTIRVEGFGADAATAGRSVIAVEVTLWSYVASTTRIADQTVQLASGGTPLGTPQTATRNTSNASQTFTFTGEVTWEQLANLGVIVKFTHDATSIGTSAYVDAVSLRIIYRPSVTATWTSAWKVAATVVGRVADFGSYLGSTSATRNLSSYGGTSVGNTALLVAVWKPATATAPDLSSQGWANISDTSVGTGADGVDIGHSRIVVWRTTVTQTDIDSGRSVTVTPVGGSNVMALSLTTFRDVGDITSEVFDNTGDLASPIASYPTLPIQYADYLLKVTADANGSLGGDPYDSLTRTGINVTAEALLSTRSTIGNHLTPVISGWIVKAPGSGTITSNHAWTGGGTTTSGSAYLRLAPVIKVLALAYSAWNIEEGGSGLTQVSNSVQSAWNIVGVVNRTTAAAWHVKATIDTPAAKAVAWRVLQAIPQSVVSAWKINAQVTAEAQSAWDVQVAVEQTKAAAWDVLSVIEQTKPTSWDVLTSINHEQAAAWKIAAEVTGSAASTWRVLAEVPTSASSAWAIDAQATQTADAAWHVREAVTQTLDSSWNVEGSLASVTQTVTSAWRILVEVPQSADTAWRVLAQIEPVVDSAWAIDAQASAVVDSAWDVQEAIEQTSSTAWNVLAVVEPSIVQSAWDVLTTVDPQIINVAWDVLTSVPDATKATAWRALALVEQAEDSAWAIDAEVTSTVESSWVVAAAEVVSTISSAWKVNAQVEQVQDSAWDVLDEVPQSVDAAWDIDAEVTSTIDAAWAIDAEVTSTLDTAWSVEAAEVTATADSAWRVLESVEQVKDATWQVKAETTALADSAWDVTTTIDSSQTSSWDVTTSVLASADAAWSVLSTVSQSAQSAWDVLASTEAALQTSAWRVTAQTSNIADVAWQVAAQTSNTVGSAWSIVGVITATAVSAWNIDGSLLAIPTGLMAVAVSRTQINLSWNAVNGATGYDVERDDVVLTTTPDTSYPDTGLDVGSTHTYRVRAVKVV